MRQKWQDQKAAAQSVFTNPRRTNGTTHQCWWVAFAQTHTRPIKDTWTVTHSQADPGYFLAPMKSFQFFHPRGWNIWILYNTDLYSLLLCARKTSPDVLLSALAADQDGTIFINQSCGITAISQKNQSRGCHTRNKNSWIKCWIEQKSSSILSPYCLHTWILNTSL